MDVYAMTRKTRPQAPTMGTAINFSDRPLIPPHHPGNNPRSPLYTPAALRPASEFALSRKNSEEMGEEYTGIVSGPPARWHWKPDNEAEICAAPGCTKTFTLFERKHHCRRCGDVFCAGDTSQTLRLDQNARFHIAGVLSRSCNRCKQEYEAWKRNGSDISKKCRPQSAKELSKRSGRVNIKSSPQDTGTVEQIASVPHDWSWSTF